MAVLRATNVDLWWASHFERTEKWRTLPNSGKISLKICKVLILSTSAKGFPQWLAYPYNEHLYWLHIFNDNINVIYWNPFPWTPMFYPLQYPHIGGKVGSNKFFVCRRGIQCWYIAESVIKMWAKILNNAQTVVQDENFLFNDIWQMLCICL